MVSKFTSLLIALAHVLPSFLIGVASVLLVLQLPSGYSQDGREPGAPAASGQTANDAAGANALNLGTGSGSKPGPPPTGAGSGNPGQ